MAARRRIDPQVAMAALDRWRLEGKQTGAQDVATAVRYSLQVLAEVAPGPSVEVRVPPYAAAQCVPGPKHTRGTPPGVIEVEPHTWLLLATGRVKWEDEVGSQALQASGNRADLSQYLPLPGWAEQPNRE